MRLFICLVLSLAIFAASSVSQAEYRAFWIEIASADGSDKKLVKSTLDPFQYVGYHPIPAGYSALYTETWMCPGRTNEQPICPSPKEREAERSLASELPTDSPSE